MCNLYFDHHKPRSGHPPIPSLETATLAIFLRCPACFQITPPVVRNVGNDREMAMMRWGMPPPPRTGGPPVTNIRNAASPHQTASPVCGTKNFVSVRLYSAPQLHRTIVAILGICPRGTPDQPQYLCDHSPLGGVVRLEGRSSTKRPRLAGCKGRGRWRRVCSNAHLGRFPAAIVTGVDRIRCPVTQIFR